MSLILSEEEIRALTGYKQPCAQLDALRKQGFHRARRNIAGAVVLERAHYEAVCAGHDGLAANDTPLLRSQRKLRAA